jgi:hypothetical protein
MPFLLTSINSRSLRNWSCRSIICEHASRRVGAMLTRNPRIINRNRWNKLKIGSVLVTMRLGSSFAAPCSAQVPCGFSTMARACSLGWFSVPEISIQSGTRTKSSGLVHSSMVPSSASSVGLSSVKVSRLRRGATTLTRSALRLRLRLRTSCGLSRGACGTER